MICPNCGNNLNDESQFCDNCGTNLANNQNVQPEIQQNVEEQKIVSEQPVQQTPVENIQPMPQPEVQSTIESKTQNKPKKGNSALIIIIVIMLMCIVGLLLYIFVIKKDETKDNKDNNTTTTTTTSTTTTTTTINNDTNDDNQNTNNNTENKYKRIANEIKNNQAENNFKTKICNSGECAEYEVSINSQKEIEVKSTKETKTIDLDGEKVKKMIHIRDDSSTVIAALTEQNNVYSVSLLKIFNSDDTYEQVNKTALSNVKDIAIVEYDCSLFSFLYLKNKGGCVEKYQIIGITENDEYIASNYQSKQYKIGDKNSYLIERLQNKNDKIEEDSFTTYGNLYIFSNGEVNYISAEEHKKMNENYDTLLFRRNITNINIHKIQANLAMFSNNKLYIVSIQNTMHIVDDLSDTNNIKATSYTDKFVKSLEVLEKDENKTPTIKKIKVNYSDDSSEILEGNGVLIFG